MSFFSRALAALHDDPRGVLATVVAAKGSTPRHLGARMFIGTDGRIVGSVGGGKIELEVMRQAAEVARTGAPAVVRHHLVRDLAMCCGGSMEVALTPGAQCQDALAQVVEAERARRPVWLDTPIDGRPWRARAPAKDERVRLRARRDGELVIEGCGVTARVVLFGAGHVGTAIGALAQTCGFEVIACDDDETGAIGAGCAWATRVVQSFDPLEVERALGGFGEDDFLLIVTRDHAVDQRILEAMIRRDDLGYLGMIGSRGKVRRFLQRLTAKGLVSGDDDPAWRRLAAPIGLDLGAETPAEIAVAVVAQLVAVTRLGQRSERAKAEPSLPKGEHAAD